MRCHWVYIRNVNLMTPHLVHVLKSYINWMGCILDNINCIKLFTFLS